jgi:hypothetical protein
MRWSERGTVVHPHFHVVYPPWRDRRAFSSAVAHLVLVRRSASMAYEYSRLSNDSVIAMRRTVVAIRPILGGILSDTARPPQRRRFHAGIRSFGSHSDTRCGFVDRAAPFAGAFSRASSRRRRRLLRTWRSDRKDTSFSTFPMEIHSPMSTNSPNHAMERTSDRWALHF